MELALRDDISMISSATDGAESPAHVRQDFISLFHQSLTRQPTSLTFPPQIHPQSLPSFRTMSTPTPTPSPSTPTPPTPTPPTLNYILSFLIVGLCWGFTTPFIRKAALTYTTPTNPSITDPRRSWLSRQIAKAFFSVLGLLRSPRYAVPLVLNLTGSVWFFLLVGQAGELVLVFFCLVQVWRGLWEGRHVEKPRGPRAQLQSGIHAA